MSITPEEKKQFVNNLLKCIDEYTYNEQSYYWECYGPIGVCGTSKFSDKILMLPNGSIIAELITKCKYGPELGYLRFNKIQGCSQSVAVGRPYVASLNVPDHTDKKGYKTLYTIYLTQFDIIGMFKMLSRFTFYSPDGGAVDLY